MRTPLIRCLVIAWLRCESNEARMKVSRIGDYALLAFTAMLPVMSDTDFVALREWGEEIIERADG